MDSSLSPPVRHIDESHAIACWQIQGCATPNWAAVGNKTGGLQEPHGINHEHGMCRQDAQECHVPIDNGPAFSNQDAPLYRYTLHAANRARTCLIPDRIQHWHHHTGQRQDVHQVTCLACRLAEHVWARPLDQGECSNLMVHIERSAVGRNYAAA